MLSLALMLSPALFWLQQANPDVFTQRLFLPHLTPVIDRHTPLNTTGTYLPPAISTTRTISGDASPLILTDTTRIAPGATLTLAPGTKIYASEFASLIVEGSLITQGTAAKPVIFSTNEQHEANQLWNGVVFGAGSHGDLRHTTIEYATPAVTCLKNSSVIGDHVQIKNTKRPSFSVTDRCL